MIEDDHDDHGGETDDDHNEGNHTKGRYTVWSIDVMLYTIYIEHNEADEGPSCTSVSQLVQRVILRLNLTTEECLGHGHNETPTTNNPRSTSAQGNFTVTNSRSETFILSMYLYLQLMDLVF